MDPLHSSTKTAGFTLSGAALVPAILWLLNDKLHVGMPVEVAALLAAGIVTVGHAAYNKWFAVSPTTTQPEQPQ